MRIFHIDSSIMMLIELEMFVLHHLVVSNAPSFDALQLFCLSLSLLLPSIKSIPLKPPHIWHSCFNHLYTLGRSIFRISHFISLISIQFIQMPIYMYIASPLWCLFRKHYIYTFFFIFSLWCGKALIASDFWWAMLRTNIMIIIWKTFAICLVFKCIQTTANGVATACKRHTTMIFFLLLWNTFFV